LTRIFVGSVSHYVVEHAPCPVLVVHPEEHPGKHDQT
jgi:nucleotide-binding universal stress UspA family protein